jgi:hypothetical protein
MLYYNIPARVFPCQPVAFQGRLPRKNAEGVKDMKITYDKGLVHWPDGITARGYRAAGSFIVHRDGPKGRAWCVTAPCGYALGNFYPDKAAALGAAKDMAPLIADWRASDLCGLFGDMQTARRAYDLARGWIAR